MIYHQFLTIRTLLNKVCYGFQHISATWCIYWSYHLKQMCTQMGHHFSYLIWATLRNWSPFLLPYLGYNMMYEPTIHIRDL